MDAELNALEDRLRQLIRLTERLRDENGQLRQQIASANNDNKLLRDRVTAARARLEGLLGRLPQDAE
jgi:cell division protein ZapB